MPALFTTIRQVTGLMMRGLGFKASNNRKRVKIYAPSYSDMTNRKCSTILAFSELGLQHQNKVLHRTMQTVPVIHILTWIPHITSKPFPHSKRKLLLSRKIYRYPVHPFTCESNGIHDNVLNLSD